MGTQAVDDPDLMAKEVSRFLKSPPDGTPAEVLQAFATVADSDIVLSPRVFLKAVDQAPIAISITDKNARILYVNETFEKLTGYSRSEAVGQNQSVLSSSSTPDEIYKDLWATIDRGEVWHGSLVNNRKDGTEYLAELMVAPVQSEGETRYHLGMHRDVTEMHQLGQRLEFQKAMTESVLDLAPVVVALLDSENKVLLDNQAYKTLRADLRGKEPAHLFLEAIGSGADTGFNNREVRLDLHGGKGPRWFTCSVVNMAELDETAHNYFRNSEASNNGLLLVANEITASRRKTQEARMNAIRAGMAEQQMMQSIQESISGAIFQLQAPLNVIRAALSMPEGMRKGDGFKTVLNQLLESGDKALQSMQAALPDVQMEQPAPVNLNEVLHDVLSLKTGQHLAYGAVIDWKPALVLPSMSAYPNAIRSLFNYLLDNALDALKESGKTHREIQILSRESDEYLEVDIIDNGPGIDEELRLKVFEPFFSGWKQRRGHAGMGLTMAQEVVATHGGHLDIDSPLNGGCRVRVSLPLHGVGQEGR
jgi:nitrogen fixation negative regulator NifL